MHAYDLVDEMDDEAIAARRTTATARYTDTPEFHAYAQSWRSLMNATSQEDYDDLTPANDRAYANLMRRTPRHELQRVIDRAQSSTR